MNKNKIFAAAVAAVAILSFSCRKGAVVYQYDMAEDGAPSGRAMMREAKKIAPMAMTASAEQNFKEKAALDSASTNREVATGAFERKLIKRGGISLEVDSIQETGKAIEQWCKDFGGYVESSYTGETEGNITVRVPSARFDEAMNAAGSMGAVKSKNISTEDVSERFYDLQTRLEARKIMRARLQTYLSQAKDMKDMLQIESELNRVVSDIESMEGSMKRLSGQINYSTIDVSYCLPYRTGSSGGFDWPDFGEGFRYFISNIVDFFAGLLKVLLYIVICGIPVLFILALLYWLLLGKVGLLKKVIRRLNGKSEK